MKIVKKLLVGLTVLVIVGLVVGILYYFHLTQEPFGSAEEYWAQETRAKLMDDVVGHFNYWLGAIDVMSYANAPFWSPDEPYRLEKYTEWCEQNMYNELILDRVAHGYYSDADYGLPKKMRGIPLMVALLGAGMAFPSLAIIEPQRSKEIFWNMGELIEFFRGPQCWMDYAIYQGWGSPLRNNVMWKGPCIFLEGLYELMTGDKRFSEEFVALCRNLYELHVQNMNHPNHPYAGVCCEPNHWFPQCNSFAILGLHIYDKLYGVDAKHGVKIGEIYARDVIKQYKEKLSSKKTGLVCRKYHPRGNQVDKYSTTFTNALVMMNLHFLEPEFTEKGYRYLRENFIRDLPLGLGSYVIENPQVDENGNPINIESDDPPSLGEAQYAITSMFAAAREFDDKETWDKLNKGLTNLFHPHYTQSELRFDDTNPEIIGADGFTLGKLLNGFSGWIMYAKVHVGWEKILTHDWSKHRTPQGDFLDTSPWR